MRAAGPSARPALALLLLLAGAEVSAAAAPPAPPLFNVSLDAAPQLRWLPVLQHYDRDFLRSAMTHIIGSGVTNGTLVHQPFWIKRLCAAVGPCIDQKSRPGAGTLPATALHRRDTRHVRRPGLQPGRLHSSQPGLRVQRILHQYCGSGLQRPHLPWPESGLSFRKFLTQLDFGRTVHKEWAGKNTGVGCHVLLQWMKVKSESEVAQSCPTLSDPMDCSLPGFSVHGIFQIAYTGTTFVGYVGLWTGQSPHKFTVSGDERDKGWWWENMIAALFQRHSPVSWLIRTTLSESENFEAAIYKLAKTPLIADVYYIVGGTSPKEGVVITRNRGGPADIWPLDPLNGAWFRVETNYDHWRPVPKGDDRRTPAIKALNATGQANLSPETLFQVLSVFPVCNNYTIYTTVMSAANPDKYMTRIRNPS